MTIAKPVRIMVIGLPTTGKTTFLAALWHVVNNADEISGALKLAQLSGDQTHLNRIREKWLTYTEVGRTTTPTEETVSMDLLDQEADHYVRVCFPDLSGERFTDQVEGRHCQNSYPKEVRDSVGALLFVHAGQAAPPRTFREGDTLAQVLDGKIDTRESTTSKAPTPWDASLVPTQVKAIELLQFLIGFTDKDAPFRIAVIFSAWDLVDSLYDSPVVFLEKRLPMLDQFLKANVEVLDARIYGISAQGGELKEESQRDLLAKKYSVPSERIIVKSESVDSHDITEPVKWLMQSTGGES